MSSFILPIILFLLSSLATGILAKGARTLGWFDMPNERSSHSTVTPRGGGLAILLVWMGFVFFLQKDIGQILILCSCLVAAIGIADDIKSVSPITRLIVHSVASMVFVISLSYSLKLERPQIYWIPPLLTLLSVWSINIFNFMDGINGIAGFQVVFVVGSLGILEYALHSEYQLSLGLVLATCGFLVWNFPRAKIFMGDVGSGFLGFAIFALFCLWDKENLFTRLGYFLALHGIFVMDSFITLTRRILSGEKWWLAHRKHAYQRLVHLRGWSHPQVVGFILAHNCCLGVIVTSSFLGFMHQSLMLFLAAVIGLSYYVTAEILAPVSRIGQTKPLHPSR